MESQSYTSFRKGRKLLAEKKRRNRINECLNQIKNLLCDDSVFSERELDDNKMEKADILESAVEFIKK
ncbi:enhancer of split m7 protein-like, partial [Patella vulgata]|uniref:enhancer of split m7 protein-like n=1 Tax=Patella vulgata TaxID=6465 RepID=UPI00217F851E